MTQGRTRNGQDQTPLTAAGPAADVHERRLMQWLFVATSCLLLLVHNGGVSGLDGETMYQVARAVVDYQRLDVGRGFNTIVGRGGKEYAKPNAGLPLHAATVYLLTAPVVWFAPGSSDFIRTGLVGGSMTLIIAGIIVAVYRLARTLGARPAAALIVGVGSVGGTYLLPYSKEFFAEPLTALGVLIAIEGTLASRPMAAGTGLAIAVLARAQSLLFVPTVIWLIARRCGVRHALVAAGPLAVAILLTAGYNLARFGRLLSFGYQDLAFTTPFLDGAQILLLSPSKSLILFVPVAVLFPWALVRLWKGNKAALCLIGSTLVISFGVAATWHDPAGGWCWGPRLLIPGLPPAIAALGPWLDRPARYSLVVALLGLGFAVSAPALAVSSQIQQLDVPRPISGVWPPDVPLPTPERQAQLVAPTARYTWAHLYERKSDGLNYLRYLTFWQLGLARMFGPPGLMLALAASLVLLFTALFAMRRCGIAYDHVRRRVGAFGSASPPDLA